MRYGSVESVIGLLKTYEYAMSVGISRSLEFEKKGLATHAINVGLRCGHGCVYCSTSSLVRTHKAFKAIGHTAFETGFCVVDPTTPERIRRSAQRLTSGDIVMMCNLTDAYSPEAQALELGRRCLEALLKESTCRVRLLTKNAAVREDYDLIEQYPGRVMVGFSITGLPEQENVIRLLEPNASPISERVAALQEAHARGISTFGMLCPCLPGIADSEDILNKMFGLVVGAGAVDVWLEPVNLRGPSLKRSEAVLRAAGRTQEADAVHSARKHSGWNIYARDFVLAVQNVARNFEGINLHVLLYRNQFNDDIVFELERNNFGLLWLKK